MQEAGALPRGGLGHAASPVEVNGAEGGAAALNVECDGVDNGGGVLDRRPYGDLIRDVGADALQAVGGLGERAPVWVAGGNTNGGAIGEQRSDDPATEETGAAEDGDDVGIEIAQRLVGGAVPARATLWTDLPRSCGSEGCYRSAAAYSGSYAKVSFGGGWRPSSECASFVGAFS